MAFLLTLAARKSDLSRIQAYKVGETLRLAHPSININYCFRESLGDQLSQDPLWKMPEQGVFTQDFYKDLIENKCDLVVHSWKDLPVDDRPQSEIIATLPREDPRDLLLVRRSAWSNIVQTKKIVGLSSSPRRIHNLSSFLTWALPAEIKKVEFAFVRGNVQTRIKKLIQGDGDALVVAKAAIDRILSSSQGEFEDVRSQIAKSLDLCYWMILPLSENPAAAAQGALAIEVRRDREDLKKLFNSINCHQTFRTVQEERRILQSYGGGCHQKIGISLSHKSYGNVLFLKGETPDQKQMQYVGLYPKKQSKKWDLKYLWSSKIYKKISERSEISIKNLVSKNSDLDSNSDSYSRSYSALWASRAESLPSSWNPSFDQILWTSGIKTWKKLAKRGFWVNGSSEGLGEQELPNIDCLTKEKSTPLKWLKLSHTDGVANPNMDFLATYNLNILPLEGLSGKKSFFWTSGSEFLQALKQEPCIKDAHHSCGPGHTFDIISKYINDTSKVTIFLNDEEWLQTVCKM